MGAVSEPKTKTRPPQTTMVGWVILVGSVYVALQSFESLSGLRSTATQELVADMLKAMGNPEGVTVEDGITALRGVTVTAAVCAAASAVLAFFALRGDTGARIGLSVLAVPLALSAAATGGFMTFMVVAAIVLLWVQPSRNWFAGLPPVEVPPLPGLGRNTTPDGGSQGGPDVPPRGPAAGGDPSADTGNPYGPAYGSGAGLTGGGSPEARAVEGFGTRATWEAPLEGPSTGGVEDRPREVKRAAWVAIVFSGLGFISALVTVAYVAQASESRMTELFDQVMTEEQRSSLAEQGLGATELTQTLTVATVIMAVLCLFGILTAVMALSGNNTGRVLLVVLSVGTLLFSLFGVLTNPVLLATLVASGYVVRQLLRPHVVAWYRRTR